MFAIILVKAGQSKIHPQMFEFEVEALRKLNDFRPDFTGYVVSMDRVAEQFAHGVANI
jgi:hypothetical protein